MLGEMRAASSSASKSPMLLTSIAVAGSQRNEKMRRKWSSRKRTRPPKRLTQRPQLLRAHGAVGARAQRMALGMQQTALLSRPAACAARGPRRSRLAAPSRAASCSGVRRLRCVARAAAASAHGATQRWQSPLPLPPLPLRAHAAALALSLALCALPAAAARRRRRPSQRLLLCGRRCRPRASPRSCRAW